MIPFGTPRRHVAQCGSTNDLARDWAQDRDDPVPSGALVTADFQTRGRGRRGRQWQAGFSESALMSFVYAVPLGAAAGQLGLVVALAVADAVASLTGLDPRLKWPNDILLDGRKAAGILVEISRLAPENEMAVLGIGVNVNQEQFVGAEEFAYPPTSLRLAWEGALEIEAVIAAVSHSLSVWEERWRTVGFAPILDGCRARLAAGALVRRGEECGALVGLTDTGAARVRLPGGTFADWSTVD